MPVYSYKCNKCGETIDILTSMDKRNDPVLCWNTGCNLNQMERLISLPQPAIIKGSVRSDVLGGLNNADWMSQDYAQRAMSGFERQKTIY